MVSPIDPLEGERYVKQVNKEGQEGYLDNIYNISSAMDDYVNSTADGNLSWKSISSYIPDSGEALKNQKNRLLEVSMRKCARIMKSVWRVGTQVCNLPTDEV